MLRRKPKPGPAQQSPAVEGAPGTRHPLASVVPNIGDLKWLAAAAAAAYVVIHLATGRGRKRKKKRRKQLLGYKVIENPAADYQPLNPRWLVAAAELARTGLPADADIDVPTPVQAFKDLVAEGAFTCEEGLEARQQLFCLEKDAIYLNHGSYGACFKLCREAQRWTQSQLEAQPVRFMESTLMTALVAARDQVARLVGAQEGDVVCVPNATTAINCVVNSLHLRKGDLLLMTSLTYPAVRSTLAEAAARSGAGVIEVQLPASVLGDRAAMHRQFRRALQRGRGRVALAVLDHVASFPPVHFEVQELTQLCRKHGAKVLVDGSHAVGAVPLDVPSLGAHFYTSNLHKWLCTPKGAALLWVDGQEQQRMRPPVVSHGYRLGYQGEFLWQGTRDDSAWCAVPAALAVFEALGWERVRQHNSVLVREAVAAMEEAFGPRQVFGLQGEYTCMAAVDLPPLQGCPPSPQAAADLHDALRNGYNIEIPAVYWSARLWVRLSAQLYNTLDDYVALVNALRELGACCLDASTGPGPGTPVPANGQPGGAAAASGGGREEVQSDESDDESDDGDGDDDEEEDGKRGGEGGSRQKQ